MFLPTLILMNKFVGFDGIVFAQSTADLVCIILAVVMFQFVKSKLKKDARFNIKKNNL